MAASGVDGLDVAHSLLNKLTSRDAVSADVQQAVQSLSVKTSVPESAFVAIRDGECPVLLCRPKPEAKRHRKKMEVGQAAALLLGAHLGEPAVRPFISQGLTRSPINVVDEPCGFILPTALSIIPANQYYRGNISRHSMGKSRSQKTEHFGVETDGDNIEVKTNIPQLMDGGYIDGNSDVIRWLQTRQGNWDENKLLNNTMLTACHNQSRYDGFMQTSTRLELTVVKGGSRYRGLLLGAVVWFEALTDDNPFTVTPMKHGNAKTSTRPYVRRDSSVRQSIIDRANEGLDRAEIREELRLIGASVAEDADIVCIDNALRLVSGRKRKKRQARGDATVCIDAADVVDESSESTAAANAIHVEEELISVDEEPGDANHSFVESPDESRQFAITAGSPPSRRASKRSAGANQTSDSPPKTRIHRYADHANVEAVPTDGDFSVAVLEGTSGGQRPVVQQEWDPARPAACSDDADVLFGAFVGAELRRLPEALRDDCKLRLQQVLCQAKRKALKINCT